jgi:hypothetical protein
MLTHLTYIVLQLHNSNYPHSKLQYKNLHEIYCVFVTEENNENDYQLSAFLEVRNQ